MEDTNFKLKGVVNKIEFFVLFTTSTAGMYRKYRPEQKARVVFLIQHGRECCKYYPQHQQP